MASRYLHTFNIPINLILLQDHRIGWEIAGYEDLGRVYISRDIVTSLVWLLNAMLHWLALHIMPDPSCNFDKISLSDIKDYLFKGNDWPACHSFYARLILQFFSSLLGASAAFDQLTSSTNTLMFVRCRTPAARKSLASNYLECDGYLTNIYSCHPSTANTITVPSRATVRFRYKWPDQD